MGNKRTKSDYHEDLDRLAESMRNYNPNEFENIESVDDAQTLLNDYFGDDSYKKLVTKSRQRELMKQIYFKQAGGKNYKNLKRDQVTDAKRIYPNSVGGRDNYQRIGSNKADLSGVDTKQAKRQTKTVKSRKFNTFGVVKGRIVEVRKIKVKFVNGKIGTRYIDKRGRFAKKKN